MAAPSIRHVEGFDDESPTQFIPATADDVVARDFRLLFELGRGGMARVYLAESLASGIQKLVVLKILNQELARHADAQQAFLREAELSARMNHPNVVQVYEVVEHAHTDIIVMEYVEGFSLHRLLQPDLPALPAPVQLEIIARMLRGLHAFHELREFDGAPMACVHRDVSPHNVLISGDGEVKVSDFGIAKVGSVTHAATSTGVIKGKIQYMAPEQLLGDTIDRRVDVFSAGVMLWEALAGRKMWSAERARDVARALKVGALPPLPQLDRSLRPLADVMARATQLAPEARYETALEMSGELERAIERCHRRVRGRDIAQHMTAAFGETRRLRRSGIAAALSGNAAASLGVISCRPLARPSPSTSGPVFLENTLVGATLPSLEAVPVPLQPTASLSALGEQRVTIAPEPGLQPPRRKRWLLALAAIALVLGGFALLANGDKGKAELAHARKQPTVGVATSPASRASTPAPEPSRAADSAAQPPLEPAPKDLQAPPSDEEEPSVSRSRPAALPRPAAPPRRNRPALRDCEPPFRLLPNGVKRFKPECF